MTSYATFEEWAKDLRFGPYVDDEIVTSVREVAKKAFEAGRLRVEWTEAERQQFRRTHGL